MIIRAGRFGESFLGKGGIQTGPKWKKGLPVMGWGFTHAKAQKQRMEHGYSVEEMGGKENSVRFAESPNSLVEGLEPGPDGRDLICLCQQGGQQG